MEELEIILEKEEKEKTIEILEEELKIIYPEASEVLNIIPTKEEQYFTGLFGEVNVNKIPDEYIIPEGTLEITESGEYDVKTYEKANVNAGANLEITNCNSLFYAGARVDIVSELLQLVKKPTSANMMFVGCVSLVDLDMSHIDGSELVILGNMFQSCSGLKNLKFMKNLGKGYTQKSTGYYNYGLLLTSSNELTHESLMDIINNLYDLNLTYKALGSSTTYTQKLQIGSTNLAKLTAEEIAVATKKGWTVS